MLNARLRELISQYADNVLDRDLARRVADLMARSQEAEAYLAQLQRLRPIIAGTLDESSRALTTLWKRLPSSHREILLLREVKGLDYSEISRFLRIPPATVRSRLSHARAKWLEHVLAAMEHNDSLALCFAGGDGVAQLNT